ncbi:MAG: head maturation protease, ClpP-related [Amphiplicatus sp.]
MRIFKIKNLAEKTVEITLYDEIDKSGFWGISHQQFAEELAALGDVDEIVLRLNSYGGDVFDGIGIYNSLRTHGARIIVHVDGVAASIASVIAMAGDEVVMEPGAMMMIHKPWLAFFVANEDDLLREAKALNKIQRSIAGRYAEKTGKPIEEIDDLINQTHWMTAEEAVDLGFADRIGDRAATDLADAEARFDAAYSALGAGFDREGLVGARAAYNAPKFFNLPPELFGKGPRSAKTTPTDGFQRQNRPNAPRAGAEAPRRTITEGVVTMDPIEELRALYVAAQDKKNAIADRAKAQGNRQLTDQELEEIEELSAEQASIDRQIKAYESINAGEAYVNGQSQGRRVDPSAAQGRATHPAAAQAGADERNDPALSAPEYLRPRNSDPIRRGDFGYLSAPLGQHAIDVANFAKSGSITPNLQRVMNATGDLTSGRSGPDGGFAVAPDVRQDIYATAIEQDPLLSRCWTPPTTGRSVQIPVDETQVWETTRGVQANPVKEGGSATESKPEFGFEDIKLHKVVALVKVTEEMLEDALFLDAYLRKKATEQLNWKASRQVVWGTGAGEALGIMTSGAKVTVPANAFHGAEVSQAADTIFAENVWDMEAALPGPNFSRAIWLHSGTAIRKLRGLTVEATGEVIGLDGLRNSSESMMSGRPTLRHELASKLGDLGDLMLFDFSQYAAPIKSGGIKEARSMHFEFDKSLESFRFTMRFGGQPLWSKPALAPDGVSYLSPFAVLAAR